MPILVPPETFLTTALHALAQLAWFMLAVVGGVAKYLDNYLRTGVFPSFKMIVANAIVSGFSGYMSAQVCLKVAPDWALIAAGVGGYLGTQGIDWVTSILRQRVESALPGLPVRKDEQEPK